jgi:hypothetical protein
VVSVAVNALQVKDEPRMRSSESRGSQVWSGIQRRWSLDTVQYSTKVLVKSARTMSQGTLEPSYPGDWQKEGARVLEIWTH